VRSTHEIVQASNRQPVANLNHELDAALADLDETDLLSLARRGHDAAFGTLFDRYRFPAERFARHLGLGAEAPDVVSESFAQMFDLLSRGKGPEHAFRAYMFTTIRHEAGRRAKVRWRVVPTDETDDLDTAVPFGDGRLDAFEQETVREAYQALPERWRSVLWALDVEGRNPREVASMHGMTPNAVSALAYRARSGLRESYLRQHINDDLNRDDSACTTTRENIVPVVRGTAKQRVRERLFQHLESCARCDAAFDDLTELNSEIGSVSASAAVAVTTAGAATAGAATWYSGVLSGVTAIKAQLVAAIIPAVAVGAVAMVPIVASGSGAAHDPRPLAVPIAVHSASDESSVDPVRTVKERNASARSKVGTSVSNALATQPSAVVEATGEPPASTGVRSVPETIAAAVTNAAGQLHLPQIAEAVVSTNIPQIIVHDASDALGDLLHGGE